MRIPSTWKRLLSTPLRSAKVSWNETRRPFSTPGPFQLVEPNRTATAFANNNNNNLVPYSRVPNELIAASTANDAFGVVSSTPEQKERNAKILTFGQRNDWRALRKLLRPSEEKDLNVVNYATFLAQLAKVPPQYRDPLLVEQAVESFVATHLDRHGTLDTRNYANILHSIAKLQLRNQFTIRVIDLFLNDSFVGEFMEKCNDQDLANVAWCLAKMNRRFLMGTLLKQLDRTPLEFLFQSSARPVTTIAWACAQLNQPAPVLFAEIDVNGGWMIAKGSPQGIANTAWACAKLGHSSPGFFEAIEIRCKHFVSHGNVRDVANVAWACATLGHSSPGLFKELGNKNNSDWIISDGLPRDLANIAWASAKLGHEAEVSFVFESIEERSDGFFDRGNPQDVAKIAWASATLDRKSPNLFAAIETSCDRLIANGNPQSVANVAWACAKLGYSSPNFFAALEKRCDWLAAKGSPQDITRTAWACTSLGHTSSAFDALSKRRSD